MAIDNPSEVQSQTQVGEHLQLGALSHHSAFACLYSTIPMQIPAVLETTVVLCFGIQAENASL